MTPRCHLVALHGFLGSPADWDVVRAEYPDAAWSTVDLWRLFSDAKVADWGTAGAAIEAEIRALVVGTELPSFLVGYSLGARLLLSVESLGPGGLPVAGACLVSCHPGLAAEDDGARTERRAADEAWAARLIEYPVARIWKEWDAQPVFAGSARPTREASLPAPRVTLARAMRVASLASQPDRRAALRAWRTPLQWVTGARDPKFGALAASLAGEGVPAAFTTIEHAGHRVPWDNPFAFARALQRWVDAVLDRTGD